MINEHHEEQAALYALGAMEPNLRSAFEREIASDRDIQEHVDSLQAMVADMSVALSDQKLPSPDLKSRVMAKIAEAASETSAPEPEESSFGHLAKERESIVVTDKDGVVEWVNATFTEMCGYSLEEVRGKKLGPFLQGRHTDPQAIVNMRHAIQNRRHITQEVLNYHKNGTPYWVTLTISPVMDCENHVRSFIAIEREIHGRWLPEE